MVKFEKFRTTNTIMASFLKVNGYMIQEVVNVGDARKPRAEFVFENVDRDLVNKFNGNQTAVEPQMFMAAYHQLVSAAKRVN